MHNLARDKETRIDGSEKTDLRCEERARRRLPQLEETPEHRDDVGLFQI